MFAVEVVLFTFLGLFNLIVHKSWLFGLLSFAAAAFILFWVLTDSHRLRQKMKKAVENAYGQKANDVTGKHRISISNEELVDINNSGKVVTPWNKVDNVILDKEYAFLVLPGPRAYIVPKRAFSNEESFHQFVEQAKTYFKSGKSPS